MQGWRRQVIGGVLALTIPCGSALVAHAEMPVWNRFFHPEPAGKRADSSRERTPSVDPLAQRQIMARQIGFEAQQQGYVAKVQGAASQNVIWVTPEERPFEQSRKSWLASWREFFSFSE